jgi:predicted DNA-binding transcriptional regulator AlpA
LKNVKRNQLRAKDLGRRRSRRDCTSRRTAEQKRSTKRVVDRRVSEADLIAAERYSAGLPLNVKHVCVITGLSRATLYRLGKGGPRWYRAGPNEKTGGFRLYEPRDVQAWLEDRKRKASGEEQPESASTETGTTRTQS